MDEQCAVLQEDEIAVLESIYPGQFELRDNPEDRPGKLLTLTIPITLSGSTVATLAPSAIGQTEAGPSKPTAPSVELHHLPPIIAKVLLPPTYPVSAPPRIISIKANLPQDGRSWLGRSVLRQVQDRLGIFWEEEKDSAGEGNGVLWRWWEWVQGGEYLLDTASSSDGLRLSVPPSIPTATFHTLLKTYNAAQLHSSFERTAFSCTICFENRKGKSCVQLPCGCVFCNPCLHACWSLAITEGTLESVACPSPECVKRRAKRSGPSDDDPDVRELDPATVESVVGADLRLRWEELKDRRRAEIDPSYCICPQPKCQAAVPPPAPPTAADLAAQQAVSSRAIRLSDLNKPLMSASANLADHATQAVMPSPSTATTASEDRWARYRQCPKCSFSFCLYCSATWHGPHAPCSFPQTSSIVLEYLSYPEGSIERARMEKRRGKQNMERMVARYIEDEENKKWLESRTRACSGCGVRVEKSHGCNHMTCGRCGSHFCYRCGDSLRPTDPYAHYRKPGSCFERLFDQEEIERFERETAMQHAGMAGGAGDLGAAGGGGGFGDEWGPRGVWDPAW